MIFLLRSLYTVLLHIAAPFVLLRLLWKSRLQPGYRRRIGERFGFVTPVPEGVAVWVHAVSVGETLAAVPLIEALVARHGEGRVWVTTTTPTGSERVAAALKGRVRHSYAPYDLPWAVALFLARVRPQRVVIMETELWPNLFRACARRGIPLVIANGRLSRRSFRGYMRLRLFFADVLGDCAAIGAQSGPDARRFHALGASRVHAVGNIKFDVNPPAAQIERGRELRARLGESRPVWIAASTHPGEEGAALAAHRQVLVQHPDAVLILVPRHPQRFAELQRTLAASGLRVTARSAIGDTGAANDLRHTQLLFGDSMGEMFMYLAAADLAFVGGSLADIGGHNVLEPAALALPVLFGPHMSNFAAARLLLLGASAAIEVRDGADLEKQVVALLGDAVQRRAMGLAAAAAVTANRGARERLLELIERQRLSDPSCNDASRQVP
jgi:3-deoxy-D-manno-octulosonic-acid transferase